MTTNKTKNFFRVSAKDFKKIPGSPIAYWVSVIGRHSFDSSRIIGSIIDTAQGMKTLDNEKFIRFWFEISLLKMHTPCKWIPINHGGDYRKWFGNNDFVVNWDKNGYEIKKLAKEKYNSVTRTVTGIEYYLHSGLTWTAISSSNFGVRYFPDGFLFSNAGMCAFGKQENITFSLALLNSSVSIFMLEILSPTINYGPNQIKKIPLPNNIKKDTDSLVHLAINTAKSDWDSYETSWDFQANPLLAVGNGLNSGGNQFDLSAIYIALRRDWQRQTEEMRRLEIENNRIFIDAYGLQDELSPEVPWNEITLTCNPWYRYGKNIENFDAVCNDFVLGKKDRIEILPVNNNESDERPADAFPFAKETEERLLEDTIKEYISYAVGCMMGRYSPEKPGLILANQGESIDDYHKKMGNRNENIANGILYSESTTNLAAPPYTVKECCGFSYHQIIDCDGVIPILDEEWFIDDIVAQFKSFLKFTFGMEHFADNLDFIEKALGKDIRKYFIKDFYKDHVQRYKKRPIYWMFSSPKGSFNALIYMHRYRPDTVSIVLNEYLREFISKIRSHREHLITENNRATLAPAEKTRNLKLIDKYAAMLTELDAYERDILYPLAQEKISIDLDDGVKVNYCKFGAALKKIPGLEAKEE